MVAAAFVVACDKGDQPAEPRDPWSSVELAVVPTVIAEVPTGPTVFVTKTGFVVDAKVIVPIVNGKVDADKEGGALGLKIPKLVTALLAQPKQDTLVLALDRTTPYRALLGAMFTAKTSPLTFRRFAIVARTADTNAVTTFALTLPDSRPAASAMSEAPLKLIVSVSRKTVILWSISGDEGTLQAPKLSLSLAADSGAKIKAALAEIANRRFGGPVPSAQRSIIFQADGDVDAATFVPMIAAMRSVFPDVMLSSGFE